MRVAGAGCVHVSCVTQKVTGCDPHAGEDADDVGFGCRIAERTM